MENGNQNSINYINKKTGGKSGFSVPSGYFETIEDSFTTKLKEKHFTKAKGFETPDSYFETIEDVILAKVSSTKKETKVISLKQRIFKMIPLAAAASIVLFIGLNTFIFNRTEANPFDQLADSEVENWVSNHINLIQDTDIALTYTDIDFDESELIPNSISHDELENYLSNQDNISLILEND